MENKNTINLVELKKLLADCFNPNGWIYYADHTSSAILGYGSFLLARQFPTFSPAFLLFSLVSVFALYRSVLFIHELTHLARKDIPFFSLYWNLVTGIPLLVPSFMYRGVHVDHHKKTTYGTPEDGEYIAFGASSIWKSILYICQSLYLPALMVIRYAVLTPVSFLHPKLRELVMKKASALAIRFDTDRKIPTGIDLRNWYVQEVLCSLFAWGMIFLFVQGYYDAYAVMHAYSIMVVMFIVNSVRTVIAHRYLNDKGAELSIQAQLADSVNIDGNPILNELLAPVGLRYHALHHLFPTIPYHSMGIAHRRLMAHLPEGSFYHQATEPSALSALATLWHNTHSEKVPDLGDAGRAR